MKAVLDNKGCSDYYWWTTLSSRPQMVIFCYRAVKKQTYLSIKYSSPLSSGGILKGQARKSTLNCDNKHDTTQKLHADLDWQLYIWGAIWLGLDVKVGDMDDVATQCARRSVGCRASQPVTEGWEVAEVTQLWLAEALGQPPMISHIPALPHSSDPMMKEREHNRGDQESVKRTIGTNYSEPEGCREMYSNRKEKKNRRE